MVLASTVRATISPPLPCEVVKIQVGNTHKPPTPIPVCPSLWPTQLACTYKEGVEYGLQLEFRQKLHPGLHRCDHNRHPPCGVIHDVGRSEAWRGSLGAKQVIGGVPEPRNSLQWSWWVSSAWSYMYMMLAGQGKGDPSRLPYQPSLQWFRSKCGLYTSGRLQLWQTLYTMPQLWQT